MAAMTAIVKCLIAVLLLSLGWAERSAKAIRGENTPE